MFACMLAVLVPTALAVGCGGDDDTESGTGGGATSDATLVLNWTPNTHHIGVYVAEAMGWYADAGIDLRIIEPTAAGAEQLLE